MRWYLLLMYAWNSWLLAKPTLGCHMGYTVVPYSLHDSLASFSGSSKKPGMIEKSIRFMCL